MHARMHVGHELVKMRAPLAGDGRRLEEEIHEHGLAAADSAVDEDAVERRALTLAPEQAVERARPVAIGSERGKERIEAVDECALCGIVFERSGLRERAIIGAERPAVRRGGNVCGHAVRIADLAIEGNGRARGQCLAVKTIGAGGT